jgi:hypothetical protein
MLTTEDKAAIERLIDHAKRDSGQAVKVANFLLAWWNAEEQGKFDIRGIWSLDDDIAEDMVRMFSFMSAHPGIYPDRLGYETDFKQIIRRHRQPSLASRRLAS